MTGVRILPDQLSDNAEALMRIVAGMAQDHSRPRLRFRLAWYQRSGFDRSSKKLMRAADQLRSVIAAPQSALASKQSVGSGS